MKTALLSVLVLINVSIAQADYQTLADGGALYANRCASCHGANGVATLPSAPNLIGQKKNYVFLQLKDFKSGVRKGTMMGQMVADLSEADFAAISEYIGATLSCK